MKIIYKIIASVLLILLVLSYTGISSVWNNLIKLQTTTVCFGVMLILFAQIISTYRWYLIIKVEGADLPFKTLFSSYMVGMFVNSFMPSSIGGDVVKTYDVYRATRNGALSTASVFMERFSGLIILLLMPWFGIKYFFDFVSPFLFWGWIGIHIVLLIAGLIFFKDRYSEIIFRLLKLIKIKKIADSASIFFDRLTNYKNRKLFLLFLLILSIPVQLATVVLYKMVANDLGVVLPFLYLIFAIPVIVIVSLTPVSIGGVGVREGITVLLFTGVGIAPEIAISISLLITCIVYLASLTGGLFLFFRKGKITNIPPKLTSSFQKKIQKKSN